MTQQKIVCKSHGIEEEEFEVKSSKGEFPKSV